MKVFDKQGKEVKNATVGYYAGGQPAHVVVDGVTYDPSGYKFEDDKTEKKTTAAKNSGALTTKDVPNANRVSKK